MARSPKKNLQILLVHSPDAHAMAQSAQASHYGIKTAADCADAAVQLSRQPFDLVLAPLQPELPMLSACANRYGVALWLVASADEMQNHLDEVAGVDDFLQTPLLEVVFLRRLQHFAERQEFSQRQTQLENLLRENASLDPLTQLPNRYFAIQSLQLLWQGFRRKSITFSCILLDLDDFKKNNDTYGQRFGDKLLKAVGLMLKERMRASDLACRYEGQQFFILCSDTALDGALHLAERLRARLGNLELTPPVEVSISACFAVVESEQRFRTPDQMLKAAEDLIQSGKSIGPNQLMTSRSRECETEVDR